MIPKRLVPAHGLLIAGLVAGAAVIVSNGRGVPEASAAAPLHVTSSAFEAGREIPTLHTCEGPDISPAIAWTGVPRGAESLALVVTDPDAPHGTLAHWVVYDIPPTLTYIPEASSAYALGAREGRNDFKTRGYSGPCPPNGRHRYFIHLYALDAVLPDLGQPDRAALERAMRGHVMTEGVLVGTYKKKK